MEPNEEPNEEPNDEKAFEELEAKLDAQFSVSSPDMPQEQDDEPEPAVQDAEPEVEEDEGAAAPAAETPGDEAEPPPADAEPGEGAPGDAADEDALPDGLTAAQQKAFWRQRRAQQALRDEMAALREEMRAAREQAAQGARGAQAAGQPGAEQAFYWMAAANRFLDGAGDVQGIRDETHAQQVRDWARRTIATGVSLTDLNAVQSAAAQGAFGALSDGVLEAVTTHAPAVIARDTAMQRTQAGAETQAAARQTTINAALEKMFVKYPALRAPEEGKAPSPEFTFSQKWIAENVGTPENPKPLQAALAADPEAVIPQLTEMMMAQYRAQQYDRAQQEQARRRGAAAERTAPLDAGAAPPAERPGPTAKTFEELEAELDRRFARPGA